MFFQIRHECLRVEYIINKLVFVQWSKIYIKCAMNEANDSRLLGKFLSSSIWWWCITFPICTVEFSTFNDVFVNETVFSSPTQNPSFSWESWDKLEVTVDISDITNKGLHFWKMFNLVLTRKEVDTGSLLIVFVFEATLLQLSLMWYASLRRSMIR